MKGLNIRILTRLMNIQSAPRFCSSAALRDLLARRRNTRSPKRAVVQSRCGSGERGEFGVAPVVAVVLDQPPRRVALSGGSDFVRHFYENIPIANSPSVDSATATIEPWWRSRATTQTNAAAPLPAPVSSWPCCAHGLIKKIPHTLRYELTTEARTTVSAILAP